MESQRKIFEQFLSMTASRARPTNEPVAHVCFYQRDCMPHNQTLLTMDQQDLLSELDAESELVRWLLWQLSTYDCTRQRIVALIFDRQTVLSEVLNMPSTSS